MSELMGDTSNCESGILLDMNFFERLQLEIVDEVHNESKCMQLVELSLSTWKVSPKAPENPADPDANCQVDLTVKCKAAEKRGTYSPAQDYVRHSNKTNMTLAEAFRKMQLDEY